MNHDPVEAIIAQHSGHYLLQALAAEPSYTLPVAVLSELLDLQGIHRPEAWTMKQLRSLEQAHAVDLLSGVGFSKARLTEAGLDHLEGRTVLEGVKRPSPKE